MDLLQGHIERKDQECIQKLSTANLNLVSYTKNLVEDKVKRKTPAITPGFSFPFSLSTES